MATEQRTHSDHSALATPNPLKPFNITVVHSRSSGQLIGAHLYAESVGNVKLYAEATTDGDMLVLVNVKVQQNSFNNNNNNRSDGGDNFNEFWAPLFGQYIIACLGALRK